MKTALTILTTLTLIACQPADIAPQVGGSTKTKTTPDSGTTGSGDVVVTTPPDGPCIPTNLDNYPQAEQDVAALFNGSLGQIRVAAQFDDYAHQITCDFSNPGAVPGEGAWVIPCTFSDLSQVRNNEPFYANIGLAISFTWTNGVQYQPASVPPGQKDFAIFRKSYGTFDLAFRSESDAPINMCAQ